MKDNRSLVIAGMIITAAVARLLPHPWNFTPIGAIALFGGAHFGNKPTAFLVPIAVEGGYFNRPGPQVIDGTELLAHLLHPAFFDWQGPASAFRRIDCNPPSLGQAALEPI